jgi:hypothetical protein
MGPSLPHGFFIHMMDKFSFFLEGPTADSVPMFMKPQAGNFPLSLQMLWKLGYLSGLVFLSELLRMCLVLKNFLIFKSIPYKLELL